MSQHLLSLSDDQLAIVDLALADLETHLAPPAALDEGQSLGLDLCPTSRKRPDTRAGLATLDPLRMRLQRLQRLVQYARDIEIILVNDALNRNLRDHALFKESGKHPNPRALLEEPPIEVA